METGTSDSFEEQFYRPKSKGDLQKAADELIDEFIAQRIDQILGADRRSIIEHYELQEKILKTLDTEMRRQFEEFANNMMRREADECLALYQAAFIDGLRLGHKAF